MILGWGCAGDIVSDDDVCIVVVVDDDGVHVRATHHHP